MGWQKVSLSVTESTWPFNSQQHLPVHVFGRKHHAKSTGLVTAETSFPGGSPAHVPSPTLITPLSAAHTSHSRGEAAASSELFYPSNSCCGSQKHLQVYVPLGPAVRQAGAVAPVPCHSSSIQMLSGRVRKTVHTGCSSRQHSWGHKNKGKELQIFPSR